ncbi:MAG: hypothetical protein RIQ50_1743 [Bacteroidota bacterium]
MFCDWYKPAFRAGGPIRSIVNLVERYAEEYDFYVYTSSSDLGGNSIVASEECEIWHRRYNCTIRYYAAGTMSLTKARRIISDVQPDLIYLNSMFSNMFFPLMAGYRTGKVIMAPRGMLRPSALSYKPIKKWIYLYLLRLLGIHQSIRFHATSVEEVHWIRKVFPSANEICVAPNIPFPLPQSLPSIEKTSGHLRAIVVGRMQSIKNIHKVLEYVNALNGRIELEIVTTSDDERYRQKICSMIDVLRNRGIQVKLVENCPPEQVHEKLKQAHLFVLPSRGESFCHAIFEALACGCPVLISDQTPWRELSSRFAGFDLALREEKIWIEKLQFFVEMGNSEWQSYREGARNKAEEYLKSSDLDVKYRLLFENMG